jgi:hypothetical protein
LRALTLAPAGIGMWMQVIVCARILRDSRLVAEPAGGPVR